MAVTLDGSNGITTPQILNAGANGSGNIGSANSYFGTLFVTNTTLTNFSATGNISTSQNLVVVGTSTLTGVVTAPTAANATNNTQVATTAYVTNKVNAATAALGSMSTQNSNAVNITGGSITGITDLAVADGGTGSSSLASNNVLLGNGTSPLQTVAPGTTNNVLSSNGSTWVSAAPTSVVPGLGYGGSGWNNLTGSRAFNTQYTNSRSYPIAVSARTTCSGGSAIDMYVNGQRISNFSWQFNGCGAFGGGFIIVPPGATYQLNSGQGVDLWVELY